MRKLPDKPSKLILLALEDLEKVERLKKFKVDMNTWFEVDLKGDIPNSKKLGPKQKCSVCFAGAVMAQSLDGVKTSIETYIQESCRVFQPALNPEDFDHDTKQKLYALNCFRVGDVQDGLEQMGISEVAIEVEEILESITERLDLEGLYSCDYKKDNPQAFKDCMMTIAGVLAAEGL